MPFTLEIDKTDKNIWNTLISQFDDASIYQTWRVGSNGNKNASLSHIILKLNDEVVACCQILIKRIPLFNTGVADINWGPLCLKSGSQYSPDIYSQIIKAIKQEYGIARRLLIRIWPHVKGEMKIEAKKILELEGFKICNVDRPYRTYIMDISQPIDDIRKNLLQKWRNILNKAEKNNLEIKFGTGDDLYECFLNLAKEMCERKDFHIGVDLNYYRCLQMDLPDNLKMQIMLCNEGNETIGAIICTAIGNTGIYLLGASGNKALKTGASYLLQWNMIEHLKKLGIHYYDLGCFNSIINPGVYHFKQGLAGKKYTEELFIGQYNGCFSLKARLVSLATLKQLFKLRIDSFRNSAQRIIHGKQDSLN